MSKTNTLKPGSWISRSNPNFIMSNLLILGNKQAYSGPNAIKQQQVTNEKSLDGSQDPEEQKQ